ncbi:MAG: cyclic nucleotide-binding domain-containing protein [bacterium]|nr:cyclic nucleotide-binding domain-containing protein [bacterium]
MLTTVEKVIFLQDVDVFAKIPLEDLAYIAMIADEVSAEAGRVIYSEGDVSDSMYLVLDGSIRLHRGGVEVMVAKPRDVFGTWALFDNETRIVTATSVEESSLLRVDKEDFLDLLSDHSKITEGVLKVLAAKLRNLVG